MILKLLTNMTLFSRPVILRRLALLARTPAPMREAVLRDGYTTSDIHFEGMSRKAAWTNLVP
jgi:hypothetical protein